MTVMGTIDRDDLCTLGAKISRARDAAYAMARGLKEDYDDGAAGSMWHFYYLLQDFEAEINRIGGGAQSSTAPTEDPTLKALVEMRAAYARKQAGPDEVPNEENEEYEALTTAWLNAEKAAYRAPVTTNGGAIAKLEYLIDDESIDLPDEVADGIAEVVAFLRRGGRNVDDIATTSPGDTKPENRVTMALDEYDRTTLALEDATVLFKAALEFSDNEPDDLSIQLVGQAYDRVTSAREILHASQRDKGSPGNR